MVLLRLGVSGKRSSVGDGETRFGRAAVSVARRRFPATTRSALMTRLLRDDVSPTARPSSRTSSSSPSRRNHARGACVGPEVLEAARARRRRAEEGAHEQGFPFFRSKSRFKRERLLSALPSARALASGRRVDVLDVGDRRSQRPRRLRVEQEPVVVLEQVHRLRLASSFAARAARRERRSPCASLAEQPDAPRAEGAPSEPRGRRSGRGGLASRVARLRNGGVPSLGGGGHAPADPVRGFGEPKRNRRARDRRREEREEHAAGDEKNKEGRKNPEGRARLRREQRLRTRRRTRLPRRAAASAGARARCARSRTARAQHARTRGVPGETATVSTPRAPTSASSSCSVKSRATAGATGPGDGRGRAS